MLPGEPGSIRDLPIRGGPAGPHLVLDVGGVGAVIVAEPPCGGQVGRTLHRDLGDVEIAIGKQQQHERQAIFSLATVIPDAEKRRRDERRR